MGGPHISLMWDAISPSHFCYSDRQGPAEVRAVGAAAPGKNILAVIQFGIAGA